MATRFRLPASGSPAVSPAFQSYTHASGTRRPLPTTDTSALTTSALAPDAADHLVAGDTSFFQGVSEPLAAQTLAAQTVTLTLQGLMAHANNALFVQLWIGVVTNSGTALATLLAKTADATVLTTSLLSRTMAPTTTAYTITAGNEGARIVVEVSLVGTPTAAGGVQGHNGSLRFGGNGAGGDLTATDGQTGTTLNPYCEFANTLVFLRVGGLTKTLDGVTADLDGTVVTPISAMRWDEGAATWDATGEGDFWDALETSLGTLTQTLAGLTTDLDAAVWVQGTLAKTLAALALTADGTALMVPRTGTLTQGLAALTTDLDGTILVQGALSRTLGDLIGDLDAAAVVQGTLSRTLAGMTLVAAGTAPSGSVGTLTQTLAALVLDADGTGLISSTFTRTLDGVTVALQGRVLVQTVAWRWDQVGLAWDQAGIHWDVEVLALDDLTVEGSGTVSGLAFLEGRLTQTLAGLSLTAQGTVLAPPTRRSLGFEGLATRRIRGTRRPAMVAVS